MKRSAAVETEETDNRTETECLEENTPRKSSDPARETSTSVSVTSEEISRQIKAVTDPLTQQLAHICELLQELRNEQPHRRYEEKASSKAASTSTGSVGQSDSERLPAEASVSFRSLQWSHLATSFVAFPRLSFNSNQKQNWLQNQFWIEFEVGPKLIRNWPKYPIRN